MQPNHEPYDLDHALCTDGGPRRGAGTQEGSTRESGRLPVDVVQGRADADPNANEVRDGARPSRGEAGPAARRVSRPAAALNCVVATFTTAGGRGEDSEASRQGAQSQIPCLFIQKQVWQRDPCLSHFDKGDLTISQYDFLIIGAGQAALPLAEALAKSGNRVAVAERRHLGGSCVNFGCIPSKAAIASARLAYDARRSAQYGLSIPEVNVDFPAVLARARNLARDARQGLEGAFPPAGNPVLLSGHARFTGRNAEGLFRLRTEDSEITAHQVILNTGTRSHIPAIDGLASIMPIHAGNWLDYTELPDHLAVLGSGPIGLEMAQFYRRMGSRVTVFTQDHQIAHYEDADIASALQTSLEQEGIEFRLNAKVSAVHRQDSGLSIWLEHGPTLLATNIFVATGRRYNTDDLGLDSIGLKTKPDGTIEVDERLSSLVKGVWVAGDIRGGPQFTHTAWDDYRILESQLIGDKRRTTDRIVPYAIFTDPELGRVGLTEREAHAQGRQIKLSRYELKRNGRAREMGRMEGFIKVFSDSANDLILGAAILGTDAAEIVQLYVDLMNAHAPTSVLRNAIHIHPTLAEAVQSAVRTL